jgi:hypothetical protein
MARIRQAKKKRAEEAAETFPTARCHCIES